MTRDELVEILQTLYTKEESEELSWELMGYKDHRLWDYVNQLTK